ncbi:S-acyl fatty acid synthase thioesterase, medium chain [Orycteropus afer afer]|uniref:oleoyl-[acyl-carrier-protein] hydrolase n=1 Tax=Orycteropus afer afer TaxID=1230840 RepID=A0A8B7AYW1_ORYAF|nr:S-acyl fatty acid synthase thioesterase, medium chain [Orycteropus afer afer]
MNRCCELSVIDLVVEELVVVFVRWIRNEKVVNCLYPKPNAIFRLICFPWAGGGSMHFAQWGQKIQDSVEGKGGQVDALHVLMGSYVAFLTALQLKEKYKLEPLHLFVSSANAPHAMFLPDIPNDDEIEEVVHDFLTEVGGTPEKLINSKQFIRECIPVTLADVCMIKNYIVDPPSEPVLSCDLTCFFGSEDKLIKDIKAWKVVTSGTFDTHRLPGNHFYLMEPSNETFIQNYITKCLELSSLY